MDRVILRDREEISLARLRAFHGGTEDATREDEEAPGWQILTLWFCSLCSQGRSSELNGSQIKD